MAKTGTLSHDDSDYTADNDPKQSLLDNHDEKDCCTTDHVSCCLMTLGCVSLIISISTLDYGLHNWLCAVTGCLCAVGGTEKTNQENGKMDCFWPIKKGGTPYFSTVTCIANTTNRIHTAVNCCAKKQTEEPGQQTMSRK